jgi:SPP1 gp7 family putative phage head morphogenesis protein
MTQKVHNVNPNSEIATALKSGKLQYKYGAFRAARFSNALSRELENIGAKYFNGAYRIEKIKLPPQLLQVLTDIENRNLQAISELTQKLVNPITVTLTASYVSDALGNILDKVEAGVMANLQGEIIPALTQAQKSEIESAFVNNLEYHINGYSQRQISKMRTDIAAMLDDGATPQEVSQYLQKRWGQAKRKADFLAFNETNIFTAQLEAFQNQSAGFTHFQWITNLDGLERPLHRVLNGNIFRYDDLPVIDERTGQKGLPATTYNCRCKAKPVRNKEFYENRQRLEN